MNGSHKNTSNTCENDFAGRSKSVTPSILGMTYSHGVKLSLNMTSEDKKEFLTNLEEWRKARREKLTARILMKQKQFEKPKGSVSILPPKLGPQTVKDNGASKIRDRQSVFERLYSNNNGKIKKLDGKTNLNRPTPTPKTDFGESVFMPSEKSVKPTPVADVAKELTNCLQSSAESESDPEKDREFTAKPENSPEEASLDPVATVESRETDTEAVAEAIEPEKSSAGTVSMNDEALLRRDGQTKPTLKGPSETNSVGESLPEEIPFKEVGNNKSKIKLRRSISMMFRQKRRAESTVRRSFSVKNLKVSNSGLPKANSGMVRPLPRTTLDNEKERKTEAATKSVSFLTPKCDNSAKSSNMRTKLEDWLIRNGHSLEGYRHLRCFGTLSNAQKPSPPSARFHPGHEHENSYYATAPNTPLDDSNKENLTPPAVTRHLDANEVGNWLKELHRLIVELKYPPERCEEWLTAIRKKCSSCTRLPTYWECLAALHESKGDLKSAIEDYERAIIKGGEVDTVGDSLAQLFERLLIEKQQRPKSKLEKGLDPKNIFKSTIIKFALQQKALKKSDSEIDPGVRQQMYVATPVRRSTRIRTSHKSNDEVASLQSLTPELRENVVFKPNESLLLGD